MALATYNGEQDMRELWGVSFPRGVAIQVDDKLAHKCRCLGFTVVDGVPVVDVDAAQVAALGAIATPEPAPRKRGRPRKVA